MDFNAMDNRKCAICDMVFDEDCDDCPARPSQIRSLRTQGVAHKGANRMTNKTAIDALKIAREALKERRAYCSEWEYKYSKEWDNEDGFIQGAIEKLATLEADKPGDTFFNDIAKCVEQTKTFSEACALYEAEKPAEDAESLLDSIFDAIKEDGIITNHNYGMRLTKESHDACIKIISAYHAEQCQICQRNELPDFARFENRSIGTTDADK